VAGKSAMKHIVVDTGYLLHLFDVDGRSDIQGRDRVRALFVAEAREGSIFYVSVPVVFELCNFIAQVRDGASRRRLASQIKSAIEGSLSIAAPWTIAPFEGDDSMRDWVDVLSAALSEFDEEFVHQEIGLTDIAVLRCANKLKDLMTNRPHPQPHVHIWTLDRQLKAREPDAEVDAFLG